MKSRELPASSPTRASTCPRSTPSRVSAPTANRRRTATMIAAPRAIIGTAIPRAIRPSSAVMTTAAAPSFHREPGHLGSSSSPRSASMALITTGSVTNQGPRDAPSTTAISAFAASIAMASSVSVALDSTNGISRRSRPGMSRSSPIRRLDPPVDAASARLSSGPARTEGSLVRESGKSSVSTSGAESTATGVPASSATTRPDACHRATSRAATTAGVSRFTRGSETWRSAASMIEPFVGHRNDADQASRLTTTELRP